MARMREGASHELSAGWPRPAAIGAGREQLAEIQRTRILSAMVAVTAEHGVGYATVARIVARSGVSRRTFYEQFVDREDCFLAAFDQSVERLAAAVLPAYRRPSRWHGRVRAGLTALLEFLDFEHDVARLVIVEALGAGPKALERRRRGIAQIVTVIEEEGGESKAGEGPLPLTAEGVIGGAFSLIHSRLASGENASLMDLLNPLVSMIVLPYLGPAAARRELQQAVSASRKGSGRPGGDPLRNLEMRLTYRTACVLVAIGAHPGASNRKVGDASGIRDQGQVSKMLGRLEHLGLVENAGESRAKGEPNKWSLTQRGGEVREVISL